MALIITVNISNDDQKVLENDLLDIEDWVQKAVLGKINACRKRTIREALAVLKADPAVTTMPASDDGLVDAFMARSGYKNRTQRDVVEVEKTKV